MAVGELQPAHTITLRGGPHHAETRHVDQPPPFKASAAGPNRHGPSYYYAFHKVGERWSATAIYIQDPYTPDLFHFHAYATD